MRAEKIPVLERRRLSLVVRSKSSPLARLQPHDRSPKVIEELIGRKNRLEEEEEVIKGKDIDGALGKMV